MAFEPTAIVVTAKEGIEAAAQSRSRRQAAAATYKPMNYCRKSAGLTGCRVKRSQLNASPKVLFGSKLILEGLGPMILIITIFVAGVFGLMVLENSDRFPDVDDLHLIISTRNE